MPRSKFAIDAEKRADERALKNAKSSDGLAILHGADPEEIAKTGVVAQVTRQIEARKAREERAAEEARLKEEIRAELEAKATRERIEAQIAREASVVSGCSAPRAE